LLGHVAVGQTVIDPSLHRLGSAAEPEWVEPGNEPREGPALKLHFLSESNEREATLWLRQRGVKLDWPVKLNGRPVGKLENNETELVHAIPVPAGTLKEGENTVEIVPPAGADDIVVGEIAIDRRTRAESIAGAVLEVRVTDTRTRREIPCRITVVDARGAFVPLAVDPAPKFATRTGVVYTADGRARIGLRPGVYTVYASRGFEYDAPSRMLNVAADRPAAVELSLRREVATLGLVACDTHVHTVTHSGHGDATVEERVVTLAGEGVELPVATDHNHLTDLLPATRRLGLDVYFTPVVGDEITSSRGHFNAFPFEPGDEPPDSSDTHWPRLLAAARKGSAARAVVLNHPRDAHSGFRPFGAENFNDVVGSGRSGEPGDFDAVELVNSGALQSDPLRVVRDWFALWNHGRQVTGVGSSDSHDVSRFTVGQGRTYVVCPDEDPGRINTAEAVRSLRAGRAIVSLGLLARLSVAERFGPGDLATGLGETLRVSVSVLGPSWVVADRVELYANGLLIRDQAIRDPGVGGEKARVEWVIPKPARDVALVAVASGPGVSAPFWPLPKPYQPASRTHNPRVLSVTNPVRVDADGDGSWSSPRYYAQLAIELAGTEATSLFRFLAGFDEAVSTQAAALILPAGRRELDPGFAAALQSAPEVVQKGFAAYEDSVADRPAGK
jgi:hypothetical protein